MYRAASAFTAPPSWKHGRLGMPLHDRHHLSGGPAGPGVRRPLESLTNQLGASYPCPSGRWRRKAIRRRAAKAQAQRRRESVQPVAEHGQDAAQPPAEVGQDAVQPPVQAPAPEPCSNGVPPPEAAEATWPSSSPAARPIKKGVRRCGAEGVAGAACSSTGLLSTALSTAAALPTASAAGKVFHFEATAESNAAVATASKAAAAAAPNTKKRAADDDAEAVEAVGHAHPGVQAVASLVGEVPALRNAKRARRDVVDLDLDTVIELLEGHGARLIYRTGRARPLEYEDWTVLPATPEEALGNPLRYETLDSDSEESKRIQADFDSTCRGKDFHVTRVCRVENDWLLHEFQQRVWRLERQCGDVAVLRVYHGTPRDNVHSIALANLDPRYAGCSTNHTWWGKGVNFSPISYYASHYGDQGKFRSMMVFDVVVGRACSASRTREGEAPLLPGDKPGWPRQRYDTNLKLPKPHVLCKFDDHQFYPAYILDYTAPPRGHRGCLEPETDERRVWWESHNFDMSSGLGPF